MYFSLGAGLEKDGQMTKRPEEFFPYLETSASLFVKLKRVNLLLTRCFGHIGIEHDVVQII